MSSRVSNHEEQEEEEEKIEQPEESTLDPQKVLNTLDFYYYNIDTIFDLTPQDLIKEPEYTPLPKLPQLKIVSRAQDLTDKIASIQYHTDVDVIKEKYNITDKTIKSTVPAQKPLFYNQPKKRTVKLPIPMTYSALIKKIPRPTKSAPVYDY